MGKLKGLTVFNNFSIIHALNVDVFCFMNSFGNRKKNKKDLPAIYANSNVHLFAYFTPLQSAQLKRQIIHVLEMLVINILILDIF